MKKLLRAALICYLLTWLGIFLLIVVLAMTRDRTLWEGLTLFAELFPSPSFQKGFHFLYGIVFLLFLLIRYFVRTFKKQGIRVVLKRLSLFIILPVGLLILGFKAIAHTNTVEDYAYEWDTSVENRTGRSKNLFALDNKQRGMSVFGWQNENKQAISDLLNSNIEWVAVIPFFYQKDEQTNAINMRDSYDRWSRQDSTFIKSIAQLHDKGLRVHLKPHLWMNSGWRSNINLDSQTDWNNWFESYRTNILHYARMAEETQVELFCIGTELKTSVTQQPEKWQQLIKEIKNIYTGKLTYAANWDGEYEEVTFWDELDFIGLQAYFPLTETENPSLEEIEKGWDVHLRMLEQLSAACNKPILFTEVGYRSSAKSTIRPWEWNSLFGKLYQKKSHRTQALAYDALFQKVWSQDWFAGMYIWQWQTRSSPQAAKNSLGFSPRFKPAENIIAKGFATHPTTTQSSVDSLSLPR
ncbi:MAG: hypothetical protein AAFP76_17565 [Bacteroidota bacterium]